MINSVGFDISDGLLIRFFAFARYWRKENGSTMRQYISYSKTSRKFRKAVLYSILREFGAPMKPVRLPKICLNKTYRKVRIGLIISLSKMSTGKTRR
jgi:hypothetical protein